MSSQFIPTSTKIDWGGHFDKWKLYRIDTPKDNNCLFHAISNAFFIPYHTQSLNNKFISRYDIVTKLRRALSDKLPQYYNVINNGNMNIGSQVDPQFKLSHMQNVLASDEQLGYGYLDYICKMLNIDIYILFESTKGLYPTDELPLIATGKRKSIVLYCVMYTKISGHYELVAIKNNDGTYTSNFHPGHDFIVYLRSLIR